GEVFLLGARELAGFADKDHAATAILQLGQVDGVTDGGEIQPRRTIRLEAACRELGKAARAGTQGQHAGFFGNLLQALAQLTQGRGARKGGEGERSRLAGRAWSLQAAFYGGEQLLQRDGLFE